MVDMSDNKELTEKEPLENKLLKKLIQAIKLQEWSFADDTRCYRKKDIDCILSRFIQENKIVVPEVEYKDLPEGRYEAMQRQLTTTQQALDSAVEALEEIANYNYDDLSDGKTQWGIAEAALASIKEKL